MTSRLALTLVLAAAAAGSPGASSAGPAPDRAVLDAAGAKLVASAQATDPGTARALAREAIGPLRSAVATSPGDCEASILLAEALLRDVDPKGALATLEAISPTACHAAAYFQLYGWALEYDERGVRRGPTAPLENAERAFEQAALEAATSEPKDIVTLGNALLRAAELAEARGERERCRIHCLRALQAQLERTAVVATALQYLRCAGPLHGEGTAFDRLAGVIDSSLFLDVTSQRLAELRRRLDKGHDDASSLCAVAYYALLANEPREDRNAIHYLVEAAALDERQPELWYLMGRANERTGRVDEAADNYRRQVALHPGAAASRLAVNDLAHLLATTRAPAEALEPVLAQLDAEIAKTPNEAAMHDTRARVLLALGRSRDAEGAWERSLALSPDPAIRHELDALRAARGGTGPGPDSRRER